MTMPATVPSKVDIALPFGSHAIDQNRTQGNPVDRADIEQLSVQVREDGARLYGVSHKIFKISIYLNFAILIIGALLGLVAMNASGNIVGFVAVIFVTGVVCALNYAVAVLTTHISKVLVHTSFACLALVEQRETERLDTGVSSNGSV